MTSIQIIIWFSLMALHKVRGIIKKQHTCETYYCPTDVRLLICCQILWPGFLNSKVQCLLSLYCCFCILSMHSCSAKSLKYYMQKHRMCQQISDFEIVKKRLWIWTEEKENKKSLHKMSNYVKINTGLENMPVWRNWQTHLTQNQAVNSRAGSSPATGI